jgi:hypothetical protein
MVIRASQPATDAPGLSRRTWLVVVSVAFALVALAIQAGLLVTSRQDASYAPDSPEAASQGYLHAWDSGDPDGAYAALSDRARSRVPEREFRDVHRWPEEESARIWIDDVSGAGEQVTLAVTVESSNPGFLRSERYRDELRIRMVREDGAWMIDTPLVGYHPL